MDEINKFSKRVFRYANLGTSAGNIAVKILGTKFLKKEHETNAQELKNILGGLKGPIMRIAQLLSTVPDLLPDCLLYTSPSPRDVSTSRMPSSA